MVVCLQNPSSPPLHVPRRLGRTPPSALTISIVASDKANLSAWWLRPPKQNGNCVLVLHGIGDSRLGSVGFAPMFTNEGYSVLLPDSRAHGDSEGQFVTYGLLEKYDVITWADWMKSGGLRQALRFGRIAGRLDIDRGGRNSTFVCGTCSGKPVLGFARGGGVRRTEYFGLARLFGRSGGKSSRKQRCPLCQVGGPPESRGGLTCSCDHSRIDSHFADTWPKRFPHSPVQFGRPGESQPTKYPLARSQCRTYGRRCSAAGRVP